ncbi:VC0807 family protein [Nocardia sp. NPDC020380]|uniref:VC0807 family protein n=1 Tax=Nocardia sp. NPDC020380 TaxID=3364309 RepID=UPI0037968944
MSDIRALGRAKPLVTAIANAAVDLLLPYIALIVLAPTGLSAALRLTIGAVLLAGKAFGGPLVRGQFRWRLALVATALPVAVLIGVHAAGFRDTLAMPAAAVVSGVICLGDLIRTWLRDKAHRVDGLAMLILSELAASIVLSSISGDARFVLARASFYTAVAGAFFLGSAVSSRPFMREALKPVATQGDPIRTAAFDRCWSVSRRFRLVYRGVTAGLGCVFLTDAALRIVIIYSHPAGSLIASGLTSQVPGIVLLVSWFLIGRKLVVPRALRILEAEVAAEQTGGDRDPLNGDSAVAA